MPEPDPALSDPTLTEAAVEDAAGPTREVAHGELIIADEDSSGPVPVPRPEPHEAVEEPAKVMRIGSMVKQLLEEVRSAPLDEPARARLKEIYETSVQELGSALSPDLRAELGRVAIPFEASDSPSEAELRVAQAQLVGWLEGLFHGIQAALFSQQMAARAQLEDMRRQLPPGSPQPGEDQPPSDRPGTYL